MKKNNLFYIFYIVILLSFTAILSLKILKRGMGASLMEDGLRENSIFEGKKLNEAYIKRLKDLEATKNLYKEPKNPMGFKDDRWRLEKPNNTYRIIALGDSMTEGMGVEAKNTWPNQLERKLNSLNFSMSFEVLNMGKGGSGTYEEVNTFKELGLRYDPDMVILQYYHNDWESPKLREKAEKLWEKYKKGEYNLPPEIEKRIQEENISESAVSGLIAQIVTENYRKKVNWEDEWDKWVKKPLIEMIKITKEKDIKLTVITWDMERINERNKLFTFLQTKNISFYDFSKYLIPEKKIPVLPFNPSYRCPSEIRVPDCHLNAKGYGIVANKTIETVLKEIEK